MSGMKIALRLPGREGSIVLDVEEGEAVLLGRRPDPERLPPSLGDGRPVRPFPLGEPAVSANHALVWIADGALHVQDLGSRHGSWLHVSADAPTAVGTAEGVSLQLGPWPRERRVDAPRDAAWTSASDYGEAVVAAIDRWLRRRGMRAQLTRTPRAPTEIGATRGDELDAGIPLADGTALRMFPLSTTEEWSTVEGDAYRYVIRQNAMFHAEESSRREGMILASPAIRRAHAQVVEAARRGARGSCCSARRARARRAWRAPTTASRGAPAARSSRATARR
jgi:hypothetical protein